jgi:hypothetical protein
MTASNGICSAFKTFQPFNRYAPFNTFAGSGGSKFRSEFPSSHKAKGSSKHSKGSNRSSAFAPFKPFRSASGSVPGVPALRSVPRAAVPYATRKISSSHPIAISWFCMTVCDYSVTARLFARRVGMQNCQF